MSALARAGASLRAAASGMLRAPFVHLTAIASLSLALAAYGTARVATGHVEALLRSLGGEVELTVYLGSDAAVEQAHEIERVLFARTGHTVHRVSPDEALGRLAAALGEDGRSLLAMDENPLPRSLEVRVPEALRGRQALEALAAAVRALPGVAGVDFGAEAVARLQRLAEVLRAATVVAFGLVFLTVAVVVSATLQLAIYARREEIEIQRLVGATDAFVRVPFLLEGIVQGLLGGALAWGLVSVGAALLARGPEAPLQLLGLSAHGGLAVDPPRLAFEQLAIGVGLGLAGSFVAVRRHLRA